MTIPETNPRTGCKAVDTVVTWTGEDGNLLVDDGDLVLWGGDFEQITRVQAGSDPTVDSVVVKLDGHKGVYFVDPGSDVAVRRYVETSSQDTEEK